MPVFTPGPTKRGLRPKNRFDICSSGSAMGGTTLDTITSCPSDIFKFAKSKSALICRPYSSPVRSFSVCTRNESRSTDREGVRSNTPRTVLVLATSMASSMRPVSGLFQCGVNVPYTHPSSQDRAMFHVSRHHPHQLAGGPADHQGAVVGPIDGISLEGTAVAVDADAPPERAGQLAPAVAHRAEPLGLVHGEPLLEVLEELRRRQGPRDALSLFDEQAGGDLAQIVGEVVRRERHVEPHAQDDVPHAFRLGAHLGEDAGQLLEIGRAHV